MQWGILVPIVAIIFGTMAGVLHKWLKLKERQLEMTSHITAEKAAQYSAHTDRLEQRVRVLERIVTDKGIDLSDEIERLRDAPHLTDAGRELKQ